MASKGVLAGSFLRTAGEQRCLLEAFYKDIHRDDKDFVGEASQFQGEGNNEVGDEAVCVADNTDFDNEPVDPNLDPTVSREKSDDELPKKQKCRNQEEVCDEPNFEQLSGQEAELFVWSNQQGDRLKWTKNNK